MTSHATPINTPPVLIMIRGLPGSGKSYLAQALQRTLGLEQVVLLDPDATDYSSEAYREMAARLTAEDVDAKFHPYRFLRAQAYAAIEAGQYIIWNQAFTNLDSFTKTVVNLQAYATDHGTKLPLLVVEVSVSTEIAKQRVAEREEQGGHGVSEEAFSRFIHDYKSFVSEGFRTVSVQGDAAVNTSVSSVLGALEAL